MSKMQKTALVLGSTGLIGSTLINLLLQDDRYAVVYAIVRKENSFQPHPKLKEVIADFNSINKIDNKLKINHIYCCIGSTKNKTPDPIKYYEIDHDYPLRVAQLFTCDAYTYISSMGANAKSSNFYLKLKGETEADLKALGLINLNILRPSLLLGKRKENRLLEDIAQRIYPALDFLLIGNLRKYRAIQAEVVAKAMLNITNKERKGVYVLESEEIKKLK